MARVKLLKAPKKPRKSSSESTMVNYLKRVSDVKKENSKRIAGVKRKEGLYKRVQAAKI